MKIGKGILVIILLVMAGCSNSSTKTATCKVDRDGRKETYTLESKNDEVLKLTGEREIDMSEYGVDEEEIQKEMEEFEAVLKGMKITFEASIKDGIMKDKSVIDFSKVSIEDAKTSGYITVDMLSKDEKNVNLDNIVEQFEITLGVMCDN